MKVYLSLLEHVDRIIAGEPTARLLKRLHRGASLTWVISRRYSELVRYNPHVDSVLEVECLGEWVQIKGQLAGSVFDLNVNQETCPHCGVQLVKTGKGSEVTGNNWHDFGPVLPTLLTSAGLPPVSDAPLFWWKTSGIAVATDLLGRDYVVIHTTTDEADMSWPLTNWQALCYWLGTLGYSVVEIGKKPSGLTSVRYFNSPDFHDIACLIDGSSAFVGINGGFAHMANALKKKSLLILGKFGTATHYFPYTGFFENGARIIRTGDGEIQAITIDVVKTEFTRLAGI